MEEIQGAMVVLTDEDERVVILDKNIFGIPSTVTKALPDIITGPVPL